MGIDGLFSHFIHIHPQFLTKYPHLIPLTTRIDPPTKSGYPPYPQDLRLLLPIYIFLFNKHP